MHCSLSGVFSSRVVNLGLEGMLVLFFSFLTIKCDITHCKCRVVPYYASWGNARVLTLTVTRTYSHGVPASVALVYYIHLLLIHAACCISSRISLHDMWKVSVFLPSLRHVLHLQSGWPSSLIPLIKHEESSASQGHARAPLVILNTPRSTFQWEITEKYNAETVLYSLSRLCVPSYWNSTVRDRINTSVFTLRCYAVSQF